MKVWIVNPFDNLPMEGNRPQRYWLMAKAFASVGHEVVYWTSDFSHARKAKRAWLDLEFVEHVKVELVPTLPYPTNVCWERVKSHRQLAVEFERLAMAAEKPDLVIASTPPLCLCTSAMKVAHHFGAKFVCDIQDAWPETFVRLLPKSLKWLDKILFASMYRMAHTLYKKSDLVTGVCARYKELSGRDDYYLAYLGIESCEASPSQNPTEDDAFGWNVERLVYAGNLGAGYDLMTVIQAMARKPTLQLEIAGSGPAEASLKAEVARLNLETQVHFHGYLNEGELRELLNKCDVGIIPMRDDSWVGLPNKLADYLNARLYVVSSLNGECGKLLAKKGFGETYEWGSVESLIGAIERINKEIIVKLPDELKAEKIYPAYVKFATGELVKS